MSDNTPKTLHFSFTPVQSFVSQARRTRDLWTGSYLLAWLAGQAMNIILEGGGKISMPYVEDDELISAIKDKTIAENSLADSLGTLPNRFSATIPENIDATEYAKSIATAIQTAWIKVADAVRNKIDPQKSLIKDVFWQRQINNHWEFAWVMGEPPGLLDRRKNLRLPLAWEESGEKCTVCGERQELSESESWSKKDTRPNREKSKKWWNELQEKNTNDLDLREGEGLCAVCLTKRLFPLVAEDAIGWKVDKYYPSTAYLSAIDWLEQLLKNAKDPKKSKAIQDAAKEFTKTAVKLKIYKSEYNTYIQGLSENLKDSGIDETLIKLDGDAFYLSSIECGEVQTRRGDGILSNEDKRDLSKALKLLQKAAGSSATPFYALLLMDGDGMGKLIGTCKDGEREEISKALADFTGQVPDIVKRCNGRLVYAGGDDVFALLPVSKAIDCAAQCRKAYLEAFQRLPEKTKQAATISAAVQFAHMNTALGVVVRDAHRLLDDIAKERSGRDALACRVWKRGGPVLTWAQPWEIIDNGKLIEEVINDFKSNNGNANNQPSSNSDGRFSSRFFHKLRDLFEQVQTDKSVIADETEIAELLIAEYLANREHPWGDKSLDEKRCITKGRICCLMRLLRQQTRKLADDGEISYKKGLYNPDGALLVRFLVQKEV